MTDTPPADDLRERIAQALADYDLPYFSPSRRYGVADGLLAALRPGGSLNQATEVDELRATVAQLRADQPTALTDTERTMLTYALDQAQEHVWSRDGFTDEDQAALDSLRRLADEAQQDECGCDPAPLRMADGTYSHWAGCPIADAEQQAPETPADRAAVLREAIPAWEAVYEPGNVSDYLIGYANSEAAAKGAAEAWLRSQKDEIGALEWVLEDQLPASGRYERWFELLEHHADGVDIGPGIIVRRLTDEAPGGDR